MAGTIARVSFCARDLVGTGLRAAGTALSWSTCLVPIAQGLGRTNFHGRTVSLRREIKAAVGAVTAGIETGRLLRGRTGSSSRVELAVIITAGARGYAGVVDNLDAGAHDDNTPTKGLKGHLTALAHRRVTIEVLKIIVIGSGALVGGVLPACHRSTGAGVHPLTSSTVDAASSAIVIVAWANLLDLLDLRPGRVLRTACTMSTPLLVIPGRNGKSTRMPAADTLGVSLAALPEDLLEDTTLGDTGANIVDALLGTTLACHPHAMVRVGAALSGAGLILTSGKVSFSHIISRTLVLATLDGLGRRR